MNSLRLQRGKSLRPIRNSSTDRAAWRHVFEVNLFASDPLLAKPKQYYDDTNSNKAAKTAAK